MRFHHRAKRDPTPEWPMVFYRCGMWMRSGHEIAKVIAVLEAFADDREMAGDNFGVTHLAAANYATGQAAGARVAVGLLRELSS